MDNNYVLAMYDIRAKQNYIYRTKKLKEIQGASWIIRDCFDDFLYDAAKEYRDDKPADKETPEAIYPGPENKRPDGGRLGVFSFDEFEARMKDQYLGEVVYDGGGNFFILFKDEDACKEITWRFTNKLIKERPGLNVMCTYVTDVKKDNYNNPDGTGDYQRLYDKHRINENQESTITAWGTMPFIQADYISSMPLTKRIKEGVDRGNKVTAEAFAKYEKFFNVSGKEKIDEKILDKLVQEKGKESLLAVIYIDGNNMGAMVQNLLKGKQTYDDCVNMLRSFSNEIQKVCVDDRKDEIDEALEKLYKLNDREEAKTRRLVVGAGDEITVICNARYAFKIAKMYLENISKAEVNVNNEKKKITSCAGIAVFHSHTPFADAYRIAEECCETGKKKMKKYNMMDACFLDWHYCQGAIGVSLEDIREQEEMTSCSRPWLMVGDAKNNAKEIYAWEEIEKIKDELTKLERTNIKGLAESAKDGLLALEMDLKRIISHKWKAEEAKEEVPELRKAFITGETKEKQEKYKKIIFDLVLVYDIWFDESDTKEKAEEEKSETESGVMTNE